MRRLLLVALVMSWTRLLRSEISRPLLMETIRKSSEMVMARHRSGGTEAMYRRALEIELYYRGICCLSEVDCYMMSGSVPICMGRLDLEVDHRIILELKVAPKITAKHRQQLQRYVRARISTGMNVEGAAVICWTDRNTMEFYEMDIPCRSRYFAAPSQ